MLFEQFYNYAGLLTIFSDSSAKLSSKIFDLLLSHVLLFNFFKEKMKMITK
jgi:hypothetical protein